MKEYYYKVKGEQDEQKSVQPEEREEYNDTNNGVDLVDQHNSATITPHGSKTTIWHRVHDHFANQAGHQAVMHYRLVINEHGTTEQQKKINGGKLLDSKRPSGNAARGCATRLCAGS